tara:strand:- start:744 stop:1010 length:267 start_codon:yes stop_codon:yes gene_type:complete
MPRVKAKVSIPLRIFVTATFECDVEDRDDLEQYACDWASNMVDLQNYQTSVGVECGHKAEEVELDYIGDECIQDDGIQIVAFEGLDNE